MMTLAIGLLVARLLLGLALAAHGAQKLFGWFGGYGIAGTGGFFESLGFKPGVAFAVLGGLGELVGGLLTALGWLNPVGPALIIAVMLVAAITVHLAKGFWNSNGGYELPLMNIAAAVALAFAGPGQYSLDAYAPWPVLAGERVLWIVLAIAVVGALPSVFARRAPAKT